MTGSEFTAAFNVLMYIVPLLALIVSIITFSSSVNQRNRKSAAEQADIAAKIDAQSKKLDEIMEQQTKLLSGYMENREKIEGVAVHVTELDHRVSRLEREVYK